jgi:UDP-N-acetylmuramoyl-tripeptide--D-alanyl-D-alanine ligase
VRGVTPLWTSDEIAAATGGTASATFEVSGVTLVSREVGPGDLFVAMPGTVHDGHKFVDAAFAAGAAGAVVSQPVDGPHILVGDVAAALEAMARAARDRTQATIIGVTGSVGKTSTKEALFAALDRCCLGAVHRSVKSYNNHTGVPLSLARMPRNARYAVLEMGMNNAGEIAALTRLIRPHVALITAIAPAHIENLGSEEAIADAKAEIFEGLEGDGVAILPNDSSHRDRLVKAARRHADRIVTFGSGDADVHAIHAVGAEGGGSLISAALLERELTFTISQRGEHWVSNALAVLAAVEAVGGDADVHAVHAVAAEGGGSLISAALLDSELTFTISQRGEHWVSNALAVLAAVEAVGGDVAVAGLALADMGGLKGRGERHRIQLDGGELLLIDESYNANPASMAATLKSLGAERGVSRRIAVLGPMRELGEHSDALHAGLAPAVIDAHVDRLILIGEEMVPLASALGGAVEVNRVASVEEATDLLTHIAGPGDAVLVKASNSVGLARLVERVVKGEPCST